MRTKRGLPKMFGGFRKLRSDGHVAEWLRSGLQNRLPRFNSGRGLQDLIRYFLVETRESGQVPKEHYP
jgi:hypothetical protein